MSAENGYEQPGIAGGGEIACGLAANASALGRAILLARSDASAWRAEEQAHALCAKVEGGDPKRVKITTKAEDLGDCDLVIEAIVEDADAKAELLAELGETAEGADLATTTSSLSVSELGKRSGHPKRLFGLHPFNPVVRMELIELCLPKAVGKKVGERAKAWCHAMGKTVVEVPDQFGFVVNRLLFPFLFDAVRLLEETKLDPEDLDRCMTMGAAHPMGPLALLDMIGLDVAESIGEQLQSATGDERDSPPKSLRVLVKAGKLGRKTGAGFYTYD
ncbi:MAG: 3-hydroxyacyl-CoA dehydrogenase family protein [Solirubrobacterales bacterium]